MSTLTFVTSRAESDERFVEWPPTHVFKHRALVPWTASESNEPPRCVVDQCKNPLVFYGVYALNQRRVLVHFCERCYEAFQLDPALILRHFSQPWTVLY